MERVCFTLQVRPDRLEEYRERHRDVWPEMLEALRRHGWRDYSLFLREDGLLVGYLETEDFRTAWEGMAREDINGRWQSSVAELFEMSDGKLADESFVRLEEVFHVD